MDQLQHLRAFLESPQGKHIEKVFFNDAMDWAFVPTKGYSLAMTRKEILSEPEKKTKDKK